MNQKAQYTKVKNEIKRLQAKGITIPDIPPLDSFNTEDLKSGYMSYKAKGWKPELIFIPPMDWDTWEAVFKQYTQTKNGLWHSSEYTNTKLLEDTDWQVMVLPATDYPPKVNITYNDTFESKSVRESSPNVDAYFALQWTMLLKGKDPVDRPSWTYLNIKDYKGLRAPASFWSPDYGQVGVRNVGVVYSAGDLGVRLPVVGKPLVPLSPPLTLYYQLTDHLLDKGHRISKPLIDDIVEFVESRNEQYS